MNARQLIEEKRRRLVPRLDEGQGRQSLELSFQLVRATALATLKGNNARETVAALTKAKALLDVGVGSDLQRFSVLHFLCAANQFAARTEEALAISREPMDVANQQKDTTYQMIGYRLQGT
jgi:hypothetical protein